MKKITIILAHPDIQNSIANKKIVTMLEEKFKNTVEIRDIQSLYPDFKIDIKTEQEILKNSDIIVFQCPMFWYSCPAILKQYLDVILEFNFAYGPKGDKLKEKEFILSMTIGGNKDSYTPLGYNHFYVETLLAHMEQTIYLTGMIWNDPIYSHQMVYVPNIYNSRGEIEARAEEHGQKLIIRLQQILDFSPENYIEDFVRSVWFKGMDCLDENGYFTQYVDGNVAFKTPEGIFKGQEGFIQWYDGLKKFFKPPVIHQIKNVAVSQENNSKIYNVTIDISVESDTHTQGKVFISVRENWKLILDNNHRIKIIEYYTTALKN